MNYKWIRSLKDSISLIVDLIFTRRLKLNVQQAIPFWIASLLVGAIAVAYTNLFNYAEFILHEILMRDSRLIFLLAPLCFLLAFLMVRLFAPNARGSGIPQVMAAIEMVKPDEEKNIHKLLGIRILITKIASSITMVLGGGAIGREGPTIQIAGSIFWVVNKWIPRSWPKLSMQRFVLTGAAAGLAAAFNTPLGGVVFAIEELSKTHIKFFRTALLTAVIIAGLTAQAILGPYLYLGYPNVKGLGYSILAGVVLVSILAGMMGSLMSKLMFGFGKWKEKFSPVNSLMFVIIAGLLVAFVAYFINWQLLGSGKSLMNDLLFTENKHNSWHTALMRILGPVLAFNTGAAGGVFAPSLAAGASVGAYISELFHLAGANANIIILSGMVGFLTGVTHTPFTSAILVLEMTDRHSVIFHLMLAALVANIVARLFEKRSLYEKLKMNFINKQ